MNLDAGPGEHVGVLVDRAAGRAESLRPTLASLMTGAITAASPLDPIEDPGADASDLPPIDQEPLVQDPVHPDASWLLLIELLRQVEAERVHPPRGEPSLEEAGLEQSSTVEIEGWPRSATPQVAAPQAAPSVPAASAVTAERQARTNDGPARSREATPDAPERRGGLETPSAQPPAPASPPDAASFDTAAPVERAVVAVTHAAPVAPALHPRASSPPDEPLDCETRTDAPASEPSPPPGVAAGAAPVARVPPATPTPPAAEGDGPLVVVRSGEGRFDAPAPAPEPPSWRPHALSAPSVRAEREAGSDAPAGRPEPGPPPRSTRSPDEVAPAQPVEAGDKDAPVHQPAPAEVLAPRSREPSAAPLNPPLRPRAPAEPPTPPAAPPEHAAPSPSLGPTVAPLEHASPTLSLGASFAAASTFLPADLTRLVPSPPSRSDVVEGDRALGGGRAEERGAGWVTSVEQPARIAASQALEPIVEPGHLLHEPDAPLAPSAHPERGVGSDAPASRSELGHRRYLDSCRRRTRPRRHSRPRRST